MLGFMIRFPMLTCEAVVTLFCFKYLSTTFFFIFGQVYARQNKTTLIKEEDVKYNTKTELFTNKQQIRRIRRNIDVFCLFKGDKRI